MKATGLPERVPLPAQAERSLCSCLLFSGESTAPVPRVKARAGGGHAKLSQADPFDREILPGCEIQDSSGVSGRTQPAPTVLLVLLPSLVPALRAQSLIAPQSETCFLKLMQQTLSNLFLSLNLLRAFYSQNVSQLRSMRSPNLCQLNS